MGRGSSGAALFDANNRIVGQLRGGWSSCFASSFSDRYGKLSTSWNGGWTSDTRLSDWLSPNQALLTTDLFDPASIAITGSDAVSCTGNTQYTLNYNLFDVAYVWEWSNNLQYISGQGTSTLTVAPVPGSTTSGFIRVTITSSKGINRSFVRTKTIYTGPPVLYSAQYTYNGSQNPLQFYTGSSSYNPLCVSQSTDVNATFTGANSVTWSKVSSSSTVAWNQNGNDLIFYLWAAGQTAVFNVQATNGCGNTSYTFGFQAINCGGGGGGCAKYTVTNTDKSSLRVVVPNIPAPCRVATANKDSSDKDIIALVKVYDMGGRLLVNKNFSNAKTASISSDLLIPGVYVIEISDGKNIERQKIVVVK